MQLEDTPVNPTLSKQSLFLIENPPPDIPSWENAMAALEDEHSAQIYSSLLLQLTNLDFAPDAAKAHWKHMLETWSSLSHAVEAQVDVRVAALHYFLEVQKELENPVIVESSLYQKLRDGVFVDNLTQLYNYRYFRDRIDQEVKRGQRYNSSLSLLRLDADDFEAFNDRYGPERGNTVLRTISQLLKDSVREIDVVSRYGGKEFAIILPSTPKSGALTVADKIRVNVEKTPITEEEGQPSKILTTSIGIASVPTDSTTSEDLIRKANDALNRAKSTGINRVEVFSDERREFSRFNVCLIGKLQVLYRDSIPVTTANISKGGFLINTNRWLQEGCVIQLHFSFGPDRHPLNCIAKIIWHAGRGPQHKTGVKIISADPSELFPFKHFIDGLPSSKKIAKR